MNREYIIKPSTTLIEALQYMDSIEKKILIICDGNVFLGLISIGDIQRAILNKRDMEGSVVDYVRNDIIYATEKDDINYIKGIMQKERIECMPVVDSDHNLTDIVEWDDLFNNVARLSVRCPVVIMAGGEGQRLRPLTNIIPKPLVPISDKTIIEEIMDRFIDVDCDDFYFSVNYMADVIKDYFGRQNDKHYNIKYLEEKEPLGTAGSLFLLKDTLKETFFVSNCDILVDINYSDLMKYHKENENVATLVSVLKTTEIPYGTVETKEKGILLRLNEKPVNTYQINAGLYVLEPRVFEYMKDGEYIHITELLSRMNDAGERVGVFPVSEKSWIDMGNWNEYMKIINREN